MKRTKRWCCRRCGRDLSLVGFVLRGFIGGVELGLPGDSGLLGLGLGLGEGARRDAPRDDGVGRLVRNGAMSGGWGTAAIGAFPTGGAPTSSGAVAVAAATACWSPLRRHEDFGGERTHLSTPIFNVCETTIAVSWISIRRWIDRWRIKI
jgi:hypothetical protein